VQATALSESVRRGDQIGPGADLLLCWLLRHDSTRHSPEHHVDGTSPPPGIKRRVGSFGATRGGRWITRKKPPKNSLCPPPIHFFWSMLASSVSPRTKRKSQLVHLLSAYRPPASGHRAHRNFWLPDGKQLLFEVAHHTVVFIEHVHRWTESAPYA
jgi:hypothetical protein